MEKIGKILEELNTQNQQPPQNLKQASVDLWTEQDDRVCDCEVCGGVGYVHPLATGVKADYTRVVPCFCQREILKQRQISRQLAECLLPAATGHMILENFDVIPGRQEAYQAGLELANESGQLKWLTLIGGVDHGKTHLGIAICRRWLERGRPARYAFVPLMLDQLRRGFQPDAVVKYPESFDFFCQIPLLILDDLGAENTTSWALEQLETIVDYRYINALPLVVTTNVPLSVLPARIASRLQRVPFGKVVVLEGKEYRLRGK